MYFDLYIYIYMCVCVCVDYTSLPGLRSLKYLLSGLNGTWIRAILQAMEQRLGSLSDERKQVQRCIEQVLQR
jgi:hypothetical protein